MVQPALQLGCRFQDASVSAWVPVRMPALVAALVVALVSQASWAQAPSRSGNETSREQRPRGEQRAAPAPRRVQPPQRDVRPAPHARDHQGDRDVAADRHDGGPGQARRFHRGDRLPTEYRSHQYVVDDWRGHRLSAPPRGYQWVQSGGDYLLVAIATGVILQLLLNP